MLYLSTTIAHFAQLATPPSRMLGVP